LIAVSVRAGETASGIKVDDWYAEPGVFPKLPANVPPPVVLPPEPAAFSSALDAAKYYAQISTGGVYTESACPTNRACVSVGSEHDGVAAAYFIGAAGSNIDVQSCTYYVYADSAGWHNVNVLCAGASPVFPSVGAAVFVTAGMGDTGCVNVRATPGRAGAVVGCLAFETAVTIDQGPVFVADQDPSLWATERMWWHLKGRGWMVHRYL
jgi:hypothetical protein